MNNCGCNSQTPVTGCSSASLQVPIQQLFADTEPTCPNAGSSSVFFATTTSGFVVPPAGGTSMLQVADGSKFAAGQWVQFVNPAGTFRVIAITGNNLTLSNAAADGISAIEGNPAPPMQYPIGAAFVTVAQPVQLTQTQFNAKVKDAMNLLTTISLNGIAVQGSGERIYLLGFLKSTLCDDTTTGCELRKVRTDGPYIDTNGKIVFPSGIQTPSVTIPVPDGGIPAQNTVALNPNAGTGGGFLLSFVNPSTGLTTYIDLFAGKLNDKFYSVKLTSTGTIELVENEFRSRIALHQNPCNPNVRLLGGSFAYGSSNAQDNLAFVLEDSGGHGICNISITEPFKPDWATHHILSIAKTYNAPQGEFLEIYAGSKLIYQEVMDSSHDYNTVIDLNVPVGTTQLTFKCLDITSGSANSWSGRDFYCRIFSKGYATFDTTTQPA